jgi:hypothetical protein
MKIKICVVGIIFLIKGDGAVGKTVFIY